MTGAASHACTAACERSVFGPKTLSMLAGQGPRAIYKTHVSLADTVSPVQIHVQNGKPDGRSRPDSVQVFWNGAQVAGSADFGAAVPEVIRSVPASAKSELKILVFGPIKSFVVVELCGGSSPVNHPPLAAAGPDISVTYPAPAVLQGYITDDGLPGVPGRTTAAWSLLSGPGTVAFDPPDAPVTAASFSAPGLYSLRLVASDGELTGSDEVTVSVLPPPPPDPCLTPPAGLIAWWTGDGSYRDSIGSNHGLGPVVPAFGPGRRGQAFAFTGSGSEVVVPHSDALRLPDSFTVEVWFKPAVDILSSDFNSPRLFSKGTANSFGIANASILDGTPGGYLEARGPTPRPMTASRSWAAGLWHHAVLTFNGSEYLIFVNGIQAARQGSAYSLLANSQNLNIGGLLESGTPLNVFHGWLDDVRIYNRALSETEVWSLFAGFPACPAPNQAPVVRAGPDQTVDFSASASLQGSVSDDGLPNPPAALSIHWTLIEGPGTVQFQNEGEAGTLATFVIPGRYLLSLSAHDGELESRDSVEILVINPLVPVPPVVGLQPDTAFARVRAATLEVGQVTTRDGDLTLRTVALPTDQGWSFEQSGNTAPESTLFGIRDGVLRMNTMGIGICGSGGNGYNYRGTVDTALPLALRIRARVLRTEGDTLRNRSGFFFSVHTGKVFLSVGLGTRDMEVNDRLFAGLDNSRFRDYRIEYVPGGSYRLYIDDSLVSDFVPSSSSTPAGIYFGDGTCGVNSEAEIASLSFQQPRVSFQNPSAGTLVARSSDVDLEILTGPGTVIVPTLKGLPRAEAETLIRLLPLSVGTIGSRHDDSVPAGQVAEQKPIAQSKVLAGTPVSFALSLGPRNRPPLAMAGPDLNGVARDSLPLTGWATDDGLPNPPGKTTVSWALISGPGTVVFGNASSPVTTATFSSEGEYLLGFTASDSEFASVDTLHVDVSEPATVCKNDRPPSWTKMLPVGPSPFGRTYMPTSTTYDEKNDVLMFFSGYGGAPPPHPAEYWVLENAMGINGTPRWHNRTPTIPGPRGRSVHSAVYDPGSNRLIIHGGCIAHCGEMLSDVWVLKNANGIGGEPAWESLPAAPIPRTGNAMAFDQKNNRMIVFGGGLDQSRNDVWILHDANGIGSPFWEELVVGGVLPPILGAPASAVYDSISNSLLVVGGRTTGWVVYNDVWVLSHANGIGGPAIWTHVPVKGDSCQVAFGGFPKPRGGHALVYSARRNTAVIYGGGVGGTGETDDAWQLLNATKTDGTAEWKKLDSSGVWPSSRFMFVSGFSESRNQMVVSMGYGILSGSYWNDTWVLNDVMRQPPPNDPPAVSAGPDQTISLPARANVSGSATDDGLPNPPGILSHSWEKISGPGTVQFTAPDSLSTPAIFSDPGEYQIEFRASDSELESRDTVKVTVKPAIAEVCGKPIIDVPVPRKDGSGPGRWIPAQDMGTRRANHTADLLPNGKVLLAGGIRIQTGQISSMVELFDPVSLAMTAVDSMRHPRYLHGSARLADGKIMVMGGYSAGASLRSVEIYDPTTGIWDSAASLHSPRNAFAQVSLPDGRIMVIGGSGAANLSSVEAYDPSTKTWNLLADMQVPRRDHAAVLLQDGRVLVVGGRNALHLRSCEVYNPATNTWTMTGDMSSARFAHGVSTLGDGRVFVSGGIGNTHLSTTEIFNPVSGEWERGPDMQSPRQGHTHSKLADGRILIVGGERSDWQELQTTELYDPTMNSLQVMPQMLRAREEHTAIALPNGSILIAGGFAHGEKAEVFIPGSHGWIPLASMNEPRVYHTTTLLRDGRVLVTGGIAGFNNLGGVKASVEIYDPAGGTWTQAAGMNEARARHSATLLADGKVLVAGGTRMTGASCAGPNNGDALSTSEVFDPVLNSWSYAGPMHVASYVHSAVSLCDGRVLVIGGWNSKESECGDNRRVEEYNPESRTWRLLDSMEYKRNQHTATLLDENQVLVTGAWGNRTAEMYNLAENRWTRSGEMGVVRSKSTSSLLPDGRVIVMGGYGPGGSPIYKSTEIFSPADQRWREGPELITPRTEWWAGPVGNGGIIAVGGWNNIGSSSNTEILDVDDMVWRSLPNSNFQHSVAVPVLLKDGRLFIAGGGNDVNNSAQPFAEAFDLNSTPESSNQPVAVVDNYRGATGISLVVPPPGILGNDSDSDFDAVTPHLVGQAQHGSFTLAGFGGFTYVPQAGFLGVDSLTYYLSDGAHKSDTVVIRIEISHGNRPPVVSAGPDQTITLPALASLQGSASDDGLPMPPGSLSVAWSSFGGPGDVAISDPHALSPTAGFETPGQYALVLEVTDSHLSVRDTVTITVLPAPVNTAPHVSAGPDLLMSTADSIALNGSVSDDGLPTGNLTSQWTQQAGPAPLSFTNSAHPQTQVRPAAAGIHRLRLDATDGQLSGSDSMALCAAEPNVPFFDGFSNGVVDSIQRWDSGCCHGAPGVEAGGIFRTGGSAGQLPGGSDHKYYGTSARFSPLGNGVAAEARIRFTGDYQAFGFAGRAMFRRGDPGDIIIDLYTGLRPVDSIHTAFLRVIAPDSNGLWTVRFHKKIPLSWNEFHTLKMEWRQTSARWFINGEMVGEVDVPMGCRQEVSLANGRSALMETDWMRVYPIGENQKPVLAAIPERTITIPDTLRLTASASDDGLPASPGRIAYTWTQASGPGSVSFSHPDSSQTSAVFSAAGEYFLTVRATDSLLSDSTRIRVQVLPPVIPNLPPSVFAGPDQEIILPAAASLAGTVSDDGLPVGSALTSIWQSLSGPGTVTFTQPSQTSTLATFSTAGVYQLALRATDGQLATSDTMRVVVLPAAPNQPPLVSAGPDRDIMLPCATLQGLVIDDGLPAPPDLFVLWNCAAGVQLENPSNPTTQACFETEAIYPCELIAYDGEFEVRDTVHLTTSLNRAPVVQAGPDRSLMLPDSLLLTASSADDGLPNPPGTLAYQWISISGPAPVQFTAPTAPSTRAAFSEPGAYVLGLLASDGLLSDTDFVSVTVRPFRVNQPPQVFAGNDQEIQLPAFTTLSGIAQDDSLPHGPGTLTYAWSRLSGPGTVQFSAASSPTTQAVFSAAGTHILRLEVQDGALTSADTLTVTVFMGADGTFPVATLLEPPQDSTRVFTHPVPVRGTATDANLLDYVLEVCRPDGSACQTNFAGASPVVDGVLGIFDPTLLPNGMHLLRLKVRDLSNQIATATAIAIVEGGMKLGQLNFAKTDLALKAPGMDLALVREYDSRRTDGDFGPGWVLPHKAVQVAGNVDVLGQGWIQVDDGGCGFLCRWWAIKPLHLHTLVVRLSDSEVERFRMDVSPNRQRAAPLEEVRPIFIAEEGTSSRLEALDASEWAAFGADELLDTQNDQVWNPRRFRLTKRDGTIYIVDASAGLLSMTDPHGHTVTYGLNGITHSSGASINLVRDAGNRIIRATDNQGKVMRYEYEDGVLARVIQEGAGLPAPSLLEQYGFEGPKLDEIRAPDGQVLGSFIYENGRLTGLVDAHGNRVTYGYDLPSQRQCITDRLGRETCYLYDVRGNVTRKTDALGQATTYEYDARDNLIRETGPTGVSTSKTYNAAGDVLTETDGLGYITSNEYVAAGRLTRTVDPIGRETRSEYDSRGNLTRSVDALGHATTYAYDASGNQTRMVDASGHQTLYAYDAAGNLISQTDAEGNVSTYTYDSYGQQLTETRTRTTPGGPVTVSTRNAFDAQGRLVATYDPYGDSTRTEYDALGKQTATFDKLGRRTGFAYDAQGNQVKVTHPDGSSDSTVYDAEGRRTASIDRVGRVTRFEYDDLGRLVRTISPDGVATTSTYDALGRTLATTDAAGSTTTFEYADGCGCSNRRTAVINALGHATRFEYDAAGNQTAVIDALGNRTAFIYDALNRRVKTVYPDGTNDSTGYDALGRNVLKRDQAGIITRYEYDSQGRLTAVVDALGQRTLYAYDEAGNQISQTDALGRVTRFEYDNLGRRTRRILPMGQAESFTYDAAGSMLTKTDFNGRTTTYTYDILGRLLRKIPDPFFAGHPGTAFTYTASGQRATMADASGTTTYEYDGRDRLTHKATPQGTLFYTYDVVGRVASIRSDHPDGVSVDYAYDDLGRLASVRDNHVAQNGGLTTYSYTDGGSLAGYVYPNGVSTQYTYNNLNRLTLMTVTGAEPLARYVYTLGPTGNRLRVDELGGRRVEYTYDSLYRLTQEAIAGDSVMANNGSIGFAYDAVSNRLNQTSSVGPVTPYSAEYNSNDQASTDHFDANGNTLKSGERNFTWDFENRLAGMDSSNLHVDMVYDGDGNRVSKAVNGITTQFLVDDRNPTRYVQVVEERRAGDLEGYFTWGLSLLNHGRNGNSHWYHFDGHGSVRSISDEASVLINEYDYSANGETIRSKESIHNIFRYSGQQVDLNVGLYFLRTRWHAPNAGRFINFDTFQGVKHDPISLHRYLYCGSDPVNRIDPSGQFFLFTTSLTDVFLRGKLLSLNVPNVLRAANALHTVNFYYRPGFKLYTMGLNNIGKGIFDPHFLDANIMMMESGREMINYGYRIFHLGESIVSTYEIFEFVHSVRKLGQVFLNLRGLSDAYAVQAILRDAFIDAFDENWRNTYAIATRSRQTTILKKMTEELIDGLEEIESVSTDVFKWLTDYSSLEHLYENP